MPTQRRIPKPQRKALRQQDALEESAAREQLELLKAARRDVLAALTEARGFRTFHLREVLSAIDREIARGRVTAQTLATGRTARAFRLGQEFVDGAFAKIEAPASSLVDLSPELLEAVLDVTNDQVRAVWSELGTSLKATIRRTALGVTDPFEAMTDLAKVIRNPKTFGTAMARAEVIVRTETNRTFALAAQSRMEQSNERLGGGLRKWWLTANDSRVRDSHREAGERYGLDNAIPVNQAFVVGGAELMEPLDPSGPPEETINCRCRAVADVSAISVPAALGLAS